MLSGTKRKIRHGVRVVAPLSLSAILLAACGASSSSSAPGVHLGAHSALLTAYRTTQKERSFAISTVENVTTTAGSQQSRTSGYVYQTGSNPISIDAELTNNGVVPSSHENVSTTERVIGNTIYLGIPSDELGLTTLSGARWIQSTLVGPSTALTNPLGQAGSTNPTSVLAAIARRLNTQITTVGAATVNGHATTEYSANISGANFLHTLESTVHAQALAKALSTLNFDSPLMIKFWIGTNGLLRQELVHLDISVIQKGAAAIPVTISMQVDLTRYGAAFPAVKAPTSGIISQQAFLAAVEASYSH
ncbi:hypothetical protein [Ferrimicrobium sp.]|uniref:hypothetical protein n=1 Tax=Ferrimicrobium sp. TaxID=2926050 RepID=UPI00262C9F6B|nr:hypothetical protein [Ferrimicrobium sp.]